LVPLYELNARYGTVMISPVSSSTFAAPIAGLRQAQTKMDQSASTLADPASVTDAVSLSEAAVSLKMGEASFMANVQVIKAENEMLGTLINTTA
jgi:flagellar hook-associated protein FlgK